MRINNNVAALNNHRMYAFNLQGMSKSLEKLSSGMRINRAADDAAGLSISEKMRSQITGLYQAQKNAQDGISLIQTAEGALQETHSILQRMRELAVQAANDTYTSSDRSNIQKEINQLISEIDRISNTTQFNKINLLDGSSSALVSTDKLTTKVVMRDSLRIIDRFGQKSAGGGNYKIDIRTDPGAGQVLKTNIFRIKHGDDTGKGASDASVLYDVEQFWDKDGNFILDKPQTLTIVQGDGKKAEFTIYGSDTIGSLRDKINTAISDGLGQGELTGIAENDKFVSYVMPEDIPYANLNDIQRIIYGLKHGWLEMAEERVRQYYGLKGDGSDLTVKFYNNPSGTFSAFVQNITPGGALPTDGRSTNNELWINLAKFIPGDFPDGTSPVAPPFYDDRVIAHEMTHAVMSLNMNWNANVIPTWFKEGTAELIQGADERVAGDIAGNPANIAVIMGTVGAPWASASVNYSGGYIAVRYLDSLIKTFTGGASDIKDFMAYLGTNTFDQAILNYTGLANAAAFEADASGAGGQAFLTALYGGGAGSLFNADTGAIGGSDVSGGPVLTDTNVIDESLADDTVDGQPLSFWNVIWPIDTTNPLPNPAFDPFVAPYVTVPGITRNIQASGLESVGGTIVIRSAVAGAAGEFTFIGEDSVLNALGLSTIQKAEDNVYTVDIADVHSNKTIASNMTIQNNSLYGVLNPNTEVQFDPSSGVKADWDNTKNEFVLSGGNANMTSTFVHIADRSLILQIGANTLQDIGSGIGNIGSHALGVDNVLVLSNSLANYAVRKIDAAIGRVSGERSKLGAIQNRLDHTISSLMTADENLMSAESRIRDVDMAKEMMTYMKYNILAQAADAMLSQSFSMPMAVLQLLQ